MNNIRKLTVAAISVSLGESRGHFQLMLIFSCLYFNHQLIKNFQPYQEKLLNKIDLQSSTAAISAILLGLLFLRGNSSRSLIEMEVVFWALLLVNLIFIISWIRALALFYFNKFQTNVLR